MGPFSFRRTDSLTAEISDYVRLCRRTGLFTDVRLYGADPLRPVDIHGLVLYSLSPIFQQIMCSMLCDDTISLILPDAKPDDLQKFADKIYYSGSAAIPDDEDANEGVSDLYHLLRVGFLMGGIKEEINISSVHGGLVEPYVVIKQEENYESEEDYLEEESQPPPHKRPHIESNGSSPYKPENGSPKGNVMLPPKNITYVCELCKIEVVGEENFKTHSKTLHGKEDVFCCRFCPLVLKTIIDRTGHEGSSHPDFPNACPACGKSFSTKKNLTKHFRRSHRAVKAEIDKIEKTVKCQLCDAGFRTKWGLKHHLKKSHSDRPKKIWGKDTRFVKRSVCPACKIRHDDGVCCVCHQHYSAGPKKEPYLKVHWHVRVCHMCKHCDTVFSSNEEREEHLNKVHGESLFRACPYCGKQVMEASLDTHIKFIHKRNDAEQTTCDECGEMFKYPQFLKPHMILKHGTPEERAQYLKKQQAFCDLCGKMFYDRQALKKHTNHVHLKIKAFKCSICYGDFVTKQSMQNHVRSVHEGIRDQRQRPSP